MSQSLFSSLNAHIKQSSISVIDVAGYEIGFRISIPVGDVDLFLRCRVHTDSGAHPNEYEYRCLFLGVKGPNHEAKLHIYPSLVLDKYEANLHMYPYIFIFSTG
jgi:hypothetical protein